MSRNVEGLVRRSLAHAWLRQSRNWVVEAIEYSQQDHAGQPEIQQVGHGDQKFRGL